MKTLHMVPQRYQHFFLPPVVAFWWFNGVRAPSEILVEVEDEEVVMVVAVAAEEEEVDGDGGGCGGGWMRCETLPPLASSC